MINKNVLIDGIHIPNTNKTATANLEFLVNTVKKLTDVNSKSTISVGQYKSDRYYAKALVNERFMFTCGLELKDSDYGCQITRIGKIGWTKEDIVRKPVFGMLTDYLDTYISVATRIKSYL